MFDKKENPTAGKGREFRRLGEDVLYLYAVLAGQTYQFSASLFDR